MPGDRELGAGDSSPGDLSALCIEKLVPGGQGFVRVDAKRAVLVPGAFPGDLVAVEALRPKGGLMLATRWRLVERTEQRVEAVCEVEAECGGCDLMRLSLEAQRRAKLGLLADALLRTARLDPSCLPRELTSVGPALGYRSRLRLQIDDQGHIGFFQRRTRSLVQPKRCHVALPELQEALGVLRKQAHREPGALAPFAFVELRAHERGVSLYFELSSREAWVPVHSETLLRKLARRFTVATSAGGSPETLDRLALTDSVYLYAPPGAFTQINWSGNRVLIERVLEWAAASGAREFLDLYAGAGNFSLPLLAAGLGGVAVESNRAAIEAAVLAAGEQQLGGRFVTADAEQYARARQRDQRRYELLLVDPPRAGLKGGLEAVAAIAGRDLFMVSCDPVTFARDLRGLLDRGFSLKRLEAFDMFPQTHHLEVLAWLRRRE